MDINNFALQGRLTKDCELKLTKEGKPFLVFTVACGRMKRKDEEKAGADFFPCTFFGDRCEKIEGFLTKGRQVFLTGRVQTETWQEHGAWKSYTQVMVRDVNIVFTEKDKKDGERQEYATQHGRPQPVESPSEFEDDIPF